MKGITKMTELIKRIENILNDKNTAEDISIKKDDLKLLFQDFKKLNQLTISEKKEIELVYPEKEILILAKADFTYEINIINKYWNLGKKIEAISTSNKCVEYILNESIEEKNKRIEEDKKEEKVEEHNIQAYPLLLEYINFQVIELKNEIENTNFNQMNELDMKAFCINILDPFKKTKEIDFSEKELEW